MFGITVRVFTWWQWGTLVYGILFCYSLGHRYYIIIQIIHSKCHYTHYNTLYRQNRLHKPQPSPSSDHRNILIKSCYINAFNMYGVKAFADVAYISLSLTGNSHASVNTKTSLCRNTILWIPDSWKI